ncbi:Cell division protein FtsJ [gamma proteobacterium HdN1]|nr:Cell division protein FtsJ [gamma proteobacterium HdN1]
MSRSKSSSRWLREHFDDPYVKKAQQDGYRSRAAYKLLEIQEKDRILKQGMTVLDLGAAPGGWSQVAARYVGDAGHVIASDRLEMDPLYGVDFLQGDFCEEEVFAKLLQMTGNRGIDLVISDMAPNMSGNRAVDQPRAMYLVELALDMATRVLKPGGSLLVKVFQGEGFDSLRKDMHTHFRQLQTRKPDASRSRSAETYWLAKDYMG